MNLGSVLFNPQGRLGPAAFQKAALILIVIGLVLNLLPVISFALTALSALGILLIYPWVCIWVKRLHDANKTGWLFLAVLVAWLVVGWIAGMIVVGVFGGAAVTSGGDFSSMMQSMTAASRATALPSAIISALIAFAFVYVANMLLKSDPNPNQYGPPPGPDGESRPPADTPPSAA